jgi:hypothetical protein
MYNHEVNYAPFYFNTWNEATITIDGVEQTVWVANEHLFRNNETFIYSQADLVPVVNADGTRSASKVSASGSYTTVEGDALVGDWHFSKAVDEHGNVIYYKK